MPEETPSTQPAPGPVRDPTPEEKKPASEPVRSEKKPVEKPVKTTTPKKGGWFKRIPRDVLFSPGGVILILFAVVMEIVDLIPLPIADQIWELPFEIVFILLLVIIAKVPLKASLIPFLIERIPVINDILPTWVIRMFV